MAKRRVHRLIVASFAATVAMGVAATAGATCRQVHELRAQGLSAGDIAVALGASVGAVQACLHPRSVVVPSGRIAGPAGPAPLGAAGPAPLGAAGPAPLGAAGPAPLGAAGPPPASSNVGPAKMR